MKLNEGHYSGTVINLFWDKPYQEISFKSCYFVNKKKYCQICTCPVWFYFALLVCALFCGEIERCQLYFSIFEPMKNDVRFE